MAMMQPINANDTLDITHALYAGTTGAGKSVATQKMKLIKSGDQVVFWDLYGQYSGKIFVERQVRTYNKLSDFLRAVHAGRKTRQGFKIAFSPRVIPETKKEKRELFLKYCRVVYGFGDGHHKKTLHAIMEEINRVTTTTGNEESIYGEMLEVCRKFNIMIHSVSQRLAPIPNTVIAMSGYKWVGVQEAVGDVDRISRELGISTDEIKRLNKLEYYFKSPGFGNIVKGKLTFKNRKK
jgi:hypothetical protein